MTTGEKIKSARLAAGFTQRKLSELTGIAEPTIRKYESNRLNPKLETLIKIAEPLGVHYADLISDTIAIDEHGGISISFSGGISKDEFSDLLAKVVEIVKEFDGDEISQKDMALLYQKAILKQGKRQYKIILLPKGTEIAPRSTPAPQEGKDTAPPPSAPETAPQGK